MISVVLGAGEIGQAYYKLLKPNGDVRRVDVIKSRSDKAPKSADVLHICLRYGPDFLATVAAAVKRFKPRLINNMTTCPPGTTEMIGPDACHSTTRGLHPDLLSWIQNGTKHIGGPRAAEVAECFPGVKTVLHDHAKTTELAHILSNFLYATEIMAADEMDKICRAYGVDYFEAVQLYSKTHNDGYRELGLHSKYRPVLTPPSGRLGGHCISLPPTLIPKEIHGPLMSQLAGFGK